MLWIVMTWGWRLAKIWGSLESVNELVDAKHLAQSLVNRKHYVSVSTAAKFWACRKEVKEFHFIQWISRYNVKSFQVLSQWKFWELPKCWEHENLAYVISLFCLRSCMILKDSKRKLALRHYWVNEFDKVDMVFNDLLHANLAIWCILITKPLILRCYFILNLHNE